MALLPFPWSMFSRHSNQAADVTYQHDLDLRNNLFKVPVDYPYHSYSIFSILYQMH